MDIATHNAGSMETIQIETSRATGSHETKQPRKRLEKIELGRLNYNKAQKYLRRLKDV